MSDARTQLLALLRAKAYREGSFELSSGRHSNFYVDAKLVTLDPASIDLIGEAFFAVLQRYKVDAVGGLTLGADPIVTAIAAYSHRVHAPIPAFIVRKEPKGHGLQKWIEGPPPRAGAHVAIVEDVVTSGASALKAVDVVKRQGCHVAVVVGLLDREEGGRTTIEDQGYAFESIFTIADLRSTPDPTLGTDKLPSLTEIYTDTLRARPSS